MTDDPLAPDVEPRPDDESPPEDRPDDAVDAARPGDDVVLTAPAPVDQAAATMVADADEVAEADADTDADAADAAPLVSAEPVEPAPGEAPPAIELRNVSKVYAGHTALKKVSLRIPEGILFGLLGPNGAGKTTTLRILATLLDPTRGSAYVCGRHTVRSANRARRMVGYMPDLAGVYRMMETREYLEFFAAAYALPKDTRRRTVDEVLQLLDLGGKADALVGTLSRGMQQRLGLARVLIHDPKVLLLDEPASGLDPRARIEIREVLKELRRLGKTIILSSHILSDIEEVCDAIGIIEQGQLLFAGPVQEALARASEERIVEVRTVPGMADTAEGVLAALPQVRHVEVRGDDWIEVRLQKGETDHSFIASALVSAGIRIVMLAEHAVELEDAFLSLTKGTVA